MIFHYSLKTWKTCEYLKKKVEILYCTVQVKQYSRFVTSG
jgi:hypothetical protein